MPNQSGLPQKAAGSVGVPNQTLYLKNLPETLQKHDTRVSLYTLFSSYGPVIDVVALKTTKMRGQAHIVFRDVQASTQAMRALQDFDFFGKALKIQYAKSKSDTIAKLDGTYRMPAAVTTEVTSTTLQQSIFNIPPSSAIPLVPEVNGSTESKDEPHGVKRDREDESDHEEAAMEEDDSDVSMEASSDEDSS